MMVSHTSSYWETRQINSCYVILGPGTQSRTGFMKKVTIFWGENSVCVNNDPVFICSPRIRE